VAPEGDAAERDPIRIEAEVLELGDEGGANRRLRLRAAGWPGFDPGQFVMLSPGVLASAPRSDPLLPRPMAVYRERSEPGGAVLEILFKRHGRGTALLADARPGQRVRLVGPLGRPFAPPPSGERAVLVAGGTGIASVYELAARRLRDTGSGAPEPLVLLGARSADDLMGEADFSALGAPLRIATEDGSRGTRGLVTDLLEAALADGVPSSVYACGPTAMMRRAAEIAARRGRACAVSLENPMACGFGVCLGCAAPLRSGGFALVCRDGPVLDAADVAWEALA
jgi:dihydroorotate dehydrogenase electron transfer subunit